MEIKLRKPKFKLNTKNILNLFINIGSNTLSQIFVLVIVLLVVNIFSQKFFLRIDLTENKTYTLSQGSINILSSLEDTVVIKTYFSDNLPPDVIPVMQDVKDIFEEYARYSNGKVQVEITNPKDEDFKTKAREAGIPEIQFSELSADKFEVASGFLGASIEYKENKEALELITDVTNLEYDTTSRIYKLKTDEKTKVGFLTGHGEKSTLADFSSLTKLLETQFAIEQVSLATGQPINPDEIKVLIIASPTGEFSERDMFEIDQYIMRGGRVVVLADLYRLDFQNPVLNKTAGDLNKFLSSYGVEISEAVLLDESYLPIQSGFVQITYPFWVLAQAENINRENPALNKLETTAFFWANAVKDITNEEQIFTSLINTTNSAWEMTGDTISADPSQNWNILNQKQFTLAALIEGKQSSKFTGQEIPAIEQDESAEIPIEDMRTSEDVRVGETESARIVVIGDSDFIADDFISGTEQNSVLFTNLLEWLSGSEDLIAIRSKNIQRRPLEVISEGEKTFYKSAIVGIVPVLLIAFGIGYNVVRKRRKSSI
jgi:gliding-associated putative ABC transporter substrate-binding component GldG